MNEGWQKAVGVLVGALFVASVAWFWGSLPDGDLGLMVLSIFVESIRAQVFPMVQANLLALIGSTLAFSFMIGVVIGAMEADNYEDGGAVVIVFFGIVVGIFFGVIFGVIGVILGVVFGSIVGIVSGIFLAIVGFVIGAFVGVKVWDAFSRTTYLTVAINPLITIILLSVVWLGFKHISPSLQPVPPEMQIVQLEQTATAQIILATQEVIETATAQSVSAVEATHQAELQATLHALQLTVATDPAAILATQQAAIDATATAVAALPTLVPTSVLTLTADVILTQIAELNETLVAPVPTPIPETSAPSNTSPRFIDTIAQWLRDPIIESVAAIIAILGAVIAVVGFFRGRRGKP